MQQKQQSLKYAIKQGKKVVPKTNLILLFLNLVWMPKGFRKYYLFHGKMNRKIA